MSFIKTSWFRLATAHEFFIFTRMKPLWSSIIFIFVNLKRFDWYHITSNGVDPTLIYLPWVYVNFSWNYSCFYCGNSTENVLQLGLASLVAICLIHWTGFFFSIFFFCIPSKGVVLSSSFSLQNKNNTLIILLLLLLTLLLYSFFDRDKPHTFYCILSLTSSSLCHTVRNGTIQ